jgi:hypothetical protein
MKAYWGSGGECTVLIFCVYTPCNIEGITYCFRGNCYVHLLNRDYCHFVDWSCLFLSPVNSVVKQPWLTVGLCPLPSRHVPDSWYCFSFDLSACYKRIFKRAQSTTYGCGLELMEHKHHSVYGMRWMEGLGVVGGGATAGCYCDQRKVCGYLF